MTLNKNRIDSILIVSAALILMPARGKVSNRASMEALVSDLYARSPVKRYPQQ